MSLSKLNVLNEKDKPTVRSQKALENTFSSLNSLYRPDTVVGLVVACWLPLYKPGSGGNVTYVSAK